VGNGSASAVCRWVSNARHGLRKHPPVSRTGFALSGGVQMRPETDTAALARSAGSVPLPVAR
jgi:hypothetical protein